MYNVPPIPVDEFLYWKDTRGNSENWMMRAEQKSKSLMRNVLQKVCMFDGSVLEAKQMCSLQCKPLYYCSKLSRC